MYGQTKTKQMKSSDEEKLVDTGVKVRLIGGPLSLLEQIRMITEVSCVRDDAETPILIKTLDDFEKHFGSPLFKDDRTPLQEFTERVCADEDETDDQACRASNSSGIGLLTSHSSN